MTKKTKPEIILQLEEELGIVLSKQKSLDTLRCTPRGFIEIKNKIIAINLSAIEIKDITPICKINTLQELILYNNQLDYLTDDIGKLSSLQGLYLSGNNLHEIPKEIKHLKHLKILSVNDNILDSLPDEIGELICLEQLYLTNNLIHYIPETIGKLVVLETLFLCNNNLCELPDEIKHLKSLQSLKLQNNCLKTLPTAIGHLEKLNNLNISTNSLNILPKEIALTSSLQKLELRQNNLDYIPPEIEKLTSLTTLDLASNRINGLPRNIGKLSCLEILDVSNNPLQSLPTEIGLLKSLYYLDAHNILLQEIPEEIFQLSKLESVILSGNNIKQLSTKIGTLNYLRELDLSYNEITELPPEIGKLTKLNKLDLCTNRLKDLPDEINKLTSLSKLNLKNNELTKLRPWITNINMQIICQDGWATRDINLFGNPLESPPIEIAAQGREAIRNYFELLKDGVEKLYEAKLLIVGAGKVGKTWLLNRLVSNKIPEGKEDGTTEGIDIHNWIVNAAGVDNFRINFWDFGGQEIYHATHQYFLTRRSLYLFVWEARQDDDILSFAYWLNVISLLSNNSPVIVAMNKSDERSKEIDQKGIKENFPNIIAFHKVSAKTGQGIDNLRKEIFEEVGKLELVGNDLPIVWNRIRERLESLEENSISFEKYQEICLEFGLDAEQAEHLSRYYHDLGVFLHFEDDPILHPVIFLNPEWATDAAYMVLDNEFVRDNYGRFTYEQLRHIWQNYPEDKHAALLELMIKFEICFKLGNNAEYIVPELLKAEKPDGLDWNYKDNTRLEYKYDFMPAGIIERFIARNHSIHKDSFYWKNGVVLERKGTNALIECERFNRRIVLRLVGINRKGLLAIIRKEFDHIHNTLNNPPVKEQVECTCKTCCESDKKYLYEINKLEDRIKNNKDRVECGESYEMVDIKSILGEIIEFTVVTDEQIELFINYLQKLDQKKRKSVSKLIQEMKIACSEEDKIQILENIKIFMIKNSIPIIHSLSGAVIFEILKKIQLDKIF